MENNLATDLHRWTQIINGLVFLSKPPEVKENPAMLFIGGNPCLSVANCRF